MSLKKPHTKSFTPLDRACFSINFSTKTINLKERK